jgi:hypothetical protein
MNRVKFPLFEIIESPSITIANIKARRFDLIDRIYKKSLYYMCC